MEDRAFFFASSSSLTLTAFSSYFDVYSHAHIFIGEDPWWNPAHLMLYTGFLILLLAVWRAKKKDGVVRLSALGLVVSLVAGAFNEVWHRVLLFGNPLPEPFPVEPPHALLAVGIIISASATLLYPLAHEVVSDWRSRLAVAAASGSLWLVIAGSAFYVGRAYGSTGAYALAAGVAGFSTALFLRYSAAASGRFGFATLTYLWFMLVHYIFFITPSDGLPFGFLLVLVADYLLSSPGIGRFATYVCFLLAGPLYGLVYFPVLSLTDTVALNAGLPAATVGAFVSYALIRTVTPRLPSRRLAVKDAIQ